jgi:hypothetical protein
MGRVSYDYVLLSMAGINGWHYTSPIFQLRYLEHLGLHCLNPLSSYLNGR